MAKVVKKTQELTPAEKRQIAENLAPVKRGRGRPPKDPNAPPKEKVPSEYKINFGTILAQFGLDPALITKKHDNSQSVHIVQIGKETVLILESGHKVTLFRPEQSYKRSFGGVMELLKDYDIESGD